MASTKYVEVRELECRGAVDPSEPEPVEGSLLVGTTPVLEFEDHSRAPSYGYDAVDIFPAFHNGERCWLRRDSWQAAHGYSASGTSEYILSFEDGVKLFLERGVFAFPHPE